MELDVIQCIKNAFYFGKSMYNPITGTIYFKFSIGDNDTDPCFHPKEENAFIIRHIANYSKSSIQEDTMQKVSDLCKQTFPSFRKIRFVPCDGYKCFDIIFDLNKGETSERSLFLTKLSIDKSFVLEKENPKLYKIYSEIYSEPYIVGEIIDKIKNGNKKIYISEKEGKDICYDKLKLYLNTILENKIESIEYVNINAVYEKRRKWEYDIHVSDETYDHIIQETESYILIKDF